MKLKDFDFRIWSNNERAYIDNTLLAKAEPNAIVELWSGAYDFNGKKIFDGDIVEIFKYGESYYDIVRFNYESGFYWEFAGEWEIDYLDCGEKFRKEEDIVVRGNINENKDLYDKILKDDENDGNEKNLMNSIVGKKERLQNIVNRGI